MGSPSASTDDDLVSTEHTATPRKKSAGNSEDATPPANKAQGATPKSAPAASRQKEPPTLLADFLLGRPSPARLAAERKRRQSVEAVKAELRQEMRAGAVRKLQPPGGVRDRVKSWQRNNAAVIVNGPVDDAATEPTDVAFAGDDFESVTEEDRVRIKMRQKRRPSKRHTLSKSTGNIPSVEELIANEKPRPVVPPKKRVVSDRNWMKDRPQKSPPRKVSPLSKKSTSPTRLPKDFTLRTHNPSVSNKVKEWAVMVEKPDAQSPRSNRSSKSYDGTRSSTQLDDDGIRVKPARTKTLDDDGIRVKPVDEPTSEDRRLERKAAREARRRGKSPNPAKHESSPDQIVVEVDSSEVAQTELSTEASTAHPDTPTRRQGTSKSKMASSRRPNTELTVSSSETGEQKWGSDEESNRDSSHLPLSELGSDLTAKSIADIPGDIPWGHSAFTELAFPTNGPVRSRPKRTKVDRNASFKGVTGVFKKVAEEGKKLMHDINEPPKPQTPNNPPSIETWLNTTIDPFVGTAEPPVPPPKTSPRPEESKPTKRKPIQTKGKSSSPTSKTESRITDESTELTELTESTATSIPPRNPPAPATPQSAKEPKDTKTPPSSGLKRSRATRSHSSPLKSMGKRPFIGMLKEAFQGESTGHMNHPKVYQGVEERSYYDDGYTDYSTELSTELSGTALTGTTDEFSDVRESKERVANHAPLSLATPRLRPPTNGHHELSTIMSESSSAVGSDVSSSDASQSTLTQSTGLTKDSDPGRTLPPSTGLKRRLTKHSDLVSVLSLPNDGNVPDGIKSPRSRPSLRKTRGMAGEVTVDELLKEFADDEGLYLRELKTLVDGVVPVLLTQVVDRGDVSNLFRHNLDPQVSGISKSVVDMGIALEKLRNAHKKAPLTDIRRLAHWANGVVPIYHSYLGAWRLGFQDLFVNLAPRRGDLDDEDSLIGALPRDENGDIVDAQGQRVDVAYLLKRPLLRLKQMAKFIQCVNLIMPSHETADLVRDFEDLQEKARQRHREETARLTDEDAAGTDTTRCRDLRNLAAMHAVTINSVRQVSAKDIFSLEMQHSNGQRMQCQVELIHRDRPNHPEDVGDLLIRETGDGLGRRSYLLFPPVSMSDISARTGDGNFDMVVMIRGTHAGKKWHELLTLTADDEDQILDWLDILPVSPVPPREPELSVVGDPEEAPALSTRLPDAPIGVRGFQKTPQEKEKTDATPSRSPVTTPTKKPLPARYRPRPSSLPTTPTATSPATSPSPGRTPTQDDFRERERCGRTRPLSEAMRPDPKCFGTQKTQSSPYRDDGAPPPPAHRELSSSPSPKSRSRLQPVPVTREDGRTKRRTSSPLKHEYMPSDQSASDLSATEESASDSSDDEIESVDIPDTDLGVSLHKAIDPVTSVLSGSDCSLTPSNSASQAGLHGPKVGDENSARFLATVSRWSEQGAWKELGGQTCSILVTAGLIEAYTFRPTGAGCSNDSQADKPLIALDLTPLVLCRQSTTVDLEIRSSVQPHSRLANLYGGGNFRFRCHTGPDCFNLYMAVHHARLQNQKFIQLENEARFKSFGERRPPTANDGDTSSHRRSWFGRKNSYRGSVRAPSQSTDGASQTPSSSSATSFLKRWTVAGNLSFNLARSSVDRQSRAGSCGNSLYTSGSSSASGTPPRSPSISTNNAGGGVPVNMGTENLRIRLHLLTVGNRWEDMGNCSLTISRPPPGWRQALRANHGMEKRITVSTVPRKDSEKAVTKLDAVLGSGCFSMLGTRGIVCGVWEEVKGADGVVGMVPENGATGGNVQRWCFQFATAGEANWVLNLVHQEVMRA